MGTLSATDVMQSFSQRALAIHDDINCLTELNIIQAMHAAESLDAGLGIWGKKVVEKEPEKNNEKANSLRGVPISIKDTISLCGMDATLGYSSFSLQPSPNTSLLLGLAMSSGAIPFVKTNIPQTLISFECENPIFGTTLHPTHPHLTPGGSSGGEASLIARGGSILGIGSDIGGSLRIPAHFCGICTLKPTFGRLTTQGDRSIHSGQEGIPGVNGPMAKHVEDLEVFMRVILEKKPWDYDPSVVPIPWNPIPPREKLRIGYYTVDGYSPSSPACQRAVMDTVGALEKQGHTCVPFFPPSVQEAMSIFYGLISVDGGVSRLAPLKGDPKVSPLRVLSRALGLWWPTRTILTWAARRILKDEPTAIMLENTRKKSSLESWDFVARRNRYREQFLEAWMAMTEGEKNQAMDCIICPPSALPAFRHQGMGQAISSVSYTALYNVLDLPVGVVPVTRFSSVLDKVGADRPWSDQPIRRTERLFRQLYYPEELDGVPLGIQVVGRRYREEEVLMCMSVIESAVAYPANS